MLPPTQKIGTVGSAGQLIPGIRAKVVKEDGSLAREGEQGELIVTGPSMALRYINNEAAYVPLCILRLFLLTMDLQDEGDIRRRLGTHW